MTGYLDFDVEIGSGIGRDYVVSVRSPAGQMRSTMHFPFDELRLQSALKDLQIALLRSGGKRRLAPTAEQQTVQDFGGALFDALFAHDVRSLYHTSLDQAERQGKGLRLKLHITSPILAALPWEFLFDTRNAEYVSLSTQTPIVRYLDLPRSPRPLVVSPPLRILGMIASPSDLTELDVENEKERVKRALAGLQEQGLVRLHWLPGQTWRDLQRAVRRGPWHVFHFVGHGAFDRRADEGLVMLADDNGKARPLRATQLARLLTDHRSLRLAVLNACEGAKGGDRDIFSSTASILVQRGLPAVLAMQYEITDWAAIELSRTFYESIADGLPVDVAVAEARKAVSLAVSNTVEWGTPVLYTRAPDGILFDLMQPRSSVEEVPVEVSPAIEPEQAADDTEKEAVIAAAQPAGLVKPVSAEATPEEPQRRALSGIWLLIGAIVVVAAIIGIIAALAGGGGPLEGTPSPTEVGLAAGDLEATETAEAQATDTPVAVPDKFVITGDTLRLTDPVEMEFVRVPAGEFSMGTEAEDIASLVERFGGEEWWYDNEVPLHTVNLSEFYIGKYEVTNAQYEALVSATGHRAPSHWDNGNVPSGLEDHPVVNVSWEDAVAYTDWLSEETDLSFRLPTEAEWEKACRGTEAAIFPWGSEDVAGDLLNFADVNTDFDWPDASVDDGYAGTAPVGSYPNGVSPYGALDMAGNVWEWVADWYDSSYYERSPYDNPQEADSGTARVLRGGSWSNSAYYSRCADRGVYSPSRVREDVGFRVGLLPPSSALSTP